MHIVAGTFSSSAEARTVLHDLEILGISPANMNVIEGDDRKGFERERRPTLKAAARGALVGAIFGVVVLGALVLIARASLFELRYLALYVGGIAVSVACWSAIFAAWNMGVSHDEALLFEEASEKGSVIAAVEVTDPLEKTVIHALEDHGGRNVRSGLWQPQGWKHAYPAYDQPV